MAQDDGILQNLNGPADRADINNALAAIRSNNSGATEPAVKLPGLTWFDTSTTPPKLKIRSADNLSWLPIGTTVDVKPSFYAYKNANQVIPDQVITIVDFPAVLVNDGGYYNASLSQWVPPAGRYFIACQVCLDGNSLFPRGLNINLFIMQGVNTRIRRLEYVSTANAYHCMTAVGEMTLNGAESVRVQFNHGGKNAPISLLSIASLVWFIGHKM